LLHLEQAEALLDEPGGERVPETGASGLGRTT
jgi:hypothetical protein